MQLDFADFSAGGYPSPALSGAETGSPKHMGIHIQMNPMPSPCPSSHFEDVQHQYTHEHYYPTTPESAYSPGAEYSYTRSAYPQPSYPQESYQYADVMGVGAMPLGEQYPQTTMSAGHPSPQSTSNMGSNSIMSQSQPPSRKGTPQAPRPPPRSPPSQAAVASGSQHADVPYAKLLREAFLTRPNHELALREAYDWVEANSNKAANGGNGWKNSIRHNLSMNEAFVKKNQLESTSQPSTIWKLMPFAVEHGVKSTTRYRKKTTQRKSRPDSSSPQQAKARSGRAGGISARNSRKCQQRSSLASGYMARSDLLPPSGLDVSVAAPQAEYYHGHMVPQMSYEPMGQPQHPAHSGAPAYGSVDDVAGVFPGQQCPGSYYAQAQAPYSSISALGERQIQYHPAWTYPQPGPN